MSGSERNDLIGEAWDYSARHMDLPLLGVEEEEEQEEQGEEAGEEGEPDGTPEERGDFLPGQNEPADDGGKGDEPPPVDEKPAGEEAKGEGAKGDDKSAEDDAKGGEDDNKDFLPRYRYNRVARERDELRRQLEDLKREREQPQQQQPQQQQPQAEPAQQGPTVEEQLTEIQKDIAKAVNEGQGDKVAELMGKQTELQDQKYQQWLQQQTQQATSQTQEEIKYDRAIEKVETDHPYLNPDNEDAYDENLAGTLAQMRDAYVQQGYSLDQALNEAMTRLDPMIQMTKQQYDQARQAAQKEPEKEPEKDAGEQRTREARKTAADAAAKTPPDTSEVGRDSTKAGSGGEKYDPMKMDEEEFDALPDSTLSRLRGDVVG